ncbi:MAG: zinc-binding dehydrogenase [Pyrobaculum sp.]|uniref:zinc-binding dehydrogenase n=1 Tax=Pyrobaculum sp. TaxID=2004705 RepID=UPI00316C477E
MRAAVLHKYNQPLTVEEVEIAKPHEGEVLLKIKAAGVCHSDLYVLEGSTPVPPPLIPGHEAVAVVEEVGPAVSGLAPGDAVVTSFIWPCGRCRNCARGMENLCERFADVRLRGVLLDGEHHVYLKGQPLRVFLGGVWAEMAVVPATAVAKLPMALANRPETAMLGCAFLTAYGAVVNSGAVSPGDTVAVVGTGGVGLATVQVARAVGARVIAVGRNPEKLKLAKNHGAEVVDVREGDPVKAVRDLTGGRGADVVIEAVGSEETVDMSVEMAAAGGRVVLVGLMAVGKKAPIHIARVVRAGITIVGSYGARPRVDLPKVISLVGRGLLKPETLAGPLYSLSQVNEAVEALRSGKAVRPIIVPS